jgi:predicted O-methyltransferase YrrM
LCIALWTSTRTVVNQVNRIGRTVSQAISLQKDNPAAQIGDALVGASAQLRDIPIITQQSVAATAALARLDQERAVGATRYKALMQRLDVIETQLQQAPGLTVELVRMAERLHVGSESLPLPGGWALTGQTLLALVNEVLGSARENVVECGSGASTVWLALAVRHRGAGHVFALEHEPAYAEATRDYLRAHGLEDWASVIDAPLEETLIEGELARWYDLSALGQLPERIDLLFVDGPPGDTGRLARRPAYGLLQSRLLADAVVVLDDTNRPAEREISEDWLSRSTPHGHLVERAKVGRSTFYDMRAPARQT